MQAEDQNEFVKELEELSNEELLEKYEYFCGMVISLDEDEEELVNSYFPLYWKQQAIKWELIKRMENK